MWKFALLLALPLLEIGLFIQVGNLIGLWPTLGLVILTGVLGAAVVRSQGARAWNSLNQRFGELRDPSRPVAHGVMIILAGMLLMLPGFLTDTFGLLLLIPPVRELIMRRIASWVKLSGNRMTAYRKHSGSGTIDGDYVVENEAPQDNRSGTMSSQTGKITGDSKSGWTRH